MTKLMDIPASQLQTFYWEEGGLVIKFVKALQTDAGHEKYSTRTMILSPISGNIVRP